MKIRKRSPELEQFIAMLSPAQIGDVIPRADLLAVMQLTKPDVTFYNRLGYAKHIVRDTLGKVFEWDNTGQLVCLNEEQVAVERGRKRRRSISRAARIGTKEMETLRGKNLQPHVQRAAIAHEMIFGGVRNLARESTHKRLANVALASTRVDKAAQELLIKEMLKVKV